MRQSIVLLLILAALSGCADSEDTMPEAPNTVEAPEYEDHNQTVDENVTKNVPPVLAVTASAFNGTVPITINFTLELGDADGQPLDWAFLVNGTEVAAGQTLPSNGTDNETPTYEPASLSHNFTEPGNITIAFLVTDGNLTSEWNTTLVLAVGGPCGGEEEPCVVGEDTWVLFYSDGSCTMKPEFVQSSTGGIYINDRHTGQAGTGYVLGGGTWIYEEDNSRPGLQLGGTDLTGEFGEAAAYAACQHPDQLIF